MRFSNLRPFSLMVLLCLFILCIHSGFSQSGRVLLVGGGEEKNGPFTWSTPAYRWAGEGKKVAIVGISTGSLAPYFIQYCNVSRAKEFAIATHDSANSQATYDTLISYDVIFFRGGDQYDYYRFYKDTKLLDAVNYVYSHGGTICGTSAGMHILSSVVFTAKHGSAYPDECIENPNNSTVTLASDFLDLFPGYIFDTHFAERGRFGRLVGFLANYQLNQGKAITGIGMDDMTCMTIDENGLGTVYGTGCANIYMAGSGYSLHGTKLLADTIRIIQLLQGCTYNFKTGETGDSALDREINTESFSESGNYTILASGSDPLSDNLPMLNDLVKGTGEQSREILLLTGDTALAATFSIKLLELGASSVIMYRPGLQSGSDPALGNLIRQSRKILFLKNTYSNFSAFLGTPNGVLLQNRVKADSMVTAFAGDNARFAGKTIVENYLTEYSSYYGTLTFHKGLSLLKYTVIMPNTYLSSDIYENTVTAVPYAMLKDTLKYGIWLTNHNYMKFTPVSGKATLIGYGTAPVMVIANAGTKAGFSSHTATGSPTTAPRMVAGFEQLRLTLADETTPYIMGQVNPQGIPSLTRELPISVSPNPVHGRLTVSFTGQSFTWVIMDLAGKINLTGEVPASTGYIDVSGLSPGTYVIRVSSNSTGQSVHSKFIKI